MARGWESKSVEAQMDAVSEQPPDGAKPQPTAAEKKDQRERTGLLLTRARVAQQIESSHNERYTKSLHLALEDIDRKIAKFKA
ncbi:MAG TPA: hypothetical protein VN176_17490 [Verrucomicrobiae bacterium]|jgi:hypothetical protein|nr:hypothetical protein [Verrucomicrobiae bacterium]